MNGARTEFEIIAKALAICMPETQEETMMECEQCPFFESCDGVNTIAFPTALGIAIRSYFSHNKMSSRIIQ